MNNYEELEKNLNKLNKMFSISTIVNQSVDFSDFLEKITNFISGYIPDLKITFFSSHNGVFKAVSSNDSIKVDEYFEYDSDNEALWSILNSNKIVKAVNDNEVQIFSSFINQAGLKKLNARYIRAFFENNLPVCFCFMSLNNDKDLSEDDFLFLNNLFNYIEPNIIKFIEAKNQENKIFELQKSLYNISILYNISQAVNFIDDLKRLLQVILSKALTTLDAEKGSLMLYDYSSNSLLVKVVYGLADKITEDNINNGFMECQKIKAGEGVAGTVFLEKRAIITNLGSNDPRFVKRNALSTTQSLLCVPLIVKGEAIGVINISNKKNNKLFNQKDLEFMTSLANQAAIAIDNAKLYELATKDGLTKLYMYRHFYTLLENEIRRSVRYKHNISLLMMDIDDFKNVNDVYGHLAGDQTLREISNEIVETLRKIDIPARYGGEEFAIILPETTKEDAVIIADRLRKKIESLNIKVHKTISVKVTVSIGIAQFDFQSSDPKMLIDKADKALYNSKNSGKNVISVYNDDGDFTLIRER
ncbi:MAG: sensor domain-containing diguanylate cyclase [Cyanobacteria bacterium SIG30]|nr:sensor domain-containing diguanylate cyclase [Cyanobacteria bacterium SIG30]